ncbi:Ribosomal silencing factor RsfS [Methylobacterium thuringiense]|nr:Ribosomal silencing factor RsfS [Methylobacterium thuringiense]
MYERGPSVRTIDIGGRTLTFSCKTRAASDEAAPESGTDPLSDHDTQGADGSDALKALALGCLDDMQAEETIAIDLAGKTSLADTMIIASGRSQRHVGAIADKILQDLKAKGYGTARVEGMPACDWVLIDAGDLLVHIFRPEVRGFYNLEKIWGEDRPSAHLGG